MNKFQNVIFGQKAFIIRDGQVLIMKRKDVEIFYGMWDVPGGKVEFKDSLFQGLSREIKEESGLILNKIILILTSSKFKGKMGDRPIIFRNIYLCSADGDVKLSSEHSEFKWVNPVELIKYKFPNDADFQAVLKKLPLIIKSIKDRDLIYSSVF